MTPPSQEAHNGSEEPAHPGARCVASMQSDSDAINYDMSSGPSKIIHASPFEIRTAYGLEKSWQFVRTFLLRKMAGDIRDNPISDDLRSLVQSVLTPIGTGS